MSERWMSHFYNFTIFPVTYRLAIYKLLGFGG